MAANVTDGKGLPQRALHKTAKGSERRLKKRRVRLRSSEAVDNSLYQGIPDAAIRVSPKTIPGKTRLLAPYSNPYKTNSLNNQTKSAQAAARRRNDGCMVSPAKACLIRFKETTTTKLVFATSVEIHGEHLAF